MKKISILVQWLVVLGFLGFAAYALLKGRPVPDRQPASWRGWQGFMALSYPGIEKGDSDVYTSPARLLEQMEALHAAGYRAITPEDALAFLKEGAPLPRKALLLLFEGGRKDSVIFTVKPFRKTGFSGTLCLPTHVMRSHGAFFLHRSDIHSIAQWGFWQFAGMGHEAINEIPAGPDGARGHFLSRRIWTEAGLESPEAFRQRVAADYAACMETIEKEAGIRPLAYVYPFADAGQGPEADPDAERINREQVALLFQMAFVQAHNPFNGPGRDPFDLTRLRVPGNISGEKLVQMLEGYAPRIEEASDIHDAEAWQVDGDVRFTQNELVISADSAAWPRGSDTWSDMDVSATIRIATDTVAAVYARYASPKSFLRVTLAPAGIRVQENLEGRLRTLHWQPEPLAENTPVALRLRVKGARAWLWRGDELLAGPLPLAAHHPQGRAGLGSDAGAFAVDAFAAKPLGSVYAVASALDRFPPEDHPQAKALIVPLDPAADEPAQEQRRALLSAAAQGTEIIPLLPAGEAQAEALEGIEALLLHPITRRLITRVAVPSPTPSILQRLHDAGLGIVAMLPATDLAQGSFDAKQLQPGDMILVEGTEEESRSALDKLLATWPAYRTIAFLEASRSLELGVARAVRYGP